MKSTHVAHSQPRSAKFQVLSAKPCLTPRFALLSLLALLSLIALPSRTAAEEPEIAAQIEHERIYEGESLRYQVFLNHCDRNAKPILAGFDDFDIQLVNSTVIQSRNIISIQGRTRQVVRSGPLYEYRLTPKRTGALSIPAPAVEVDGQRYEGDSLTLTVVPAPEQDVAVLEMSVSRETVYPMQPFEVRLMVAVKPVPVPRDKDDPVSVQDPAVQLTIPWADDSKVPSGLQPKIPTNRWLAPMIRHDGGFSVNGLPADRSPFSGLFSGRSEERSALHPGAKRVLRKDAQGRRIEYWEYVFARTFVAEQVGEFTFGPVSLKGVFGTQTKSNGQLEPEAIYAYAQPVRVRVRDVPTEGRPDSYTGAVGTFRWTAEISPREAKVGDPMTLTLSLTGAGTLDRTLAPDLNGYEAVASRFKVYDATEETKDSTRRFVYSLRPKHARVAELPAIPISCFDVEEEKFVTLESDAIPLKIEEADRLSSADIAMATPLAANGNGIEVRSEGIFANVTDLRELRDETVHPDRWFLSLGGLAGLFFVVAFVTQQVQTRRADTGLQRRRGAVRAAQDRLRSATEALGSGDRKQGVDSLSGALLGLVADACGLDRGSHTSQDAIARLRAEGIEEPLVERFTAVMQACDDARYGASADSADELVASVRKCLDELIRGLKARRLLS